MSLATRPIIPRLALALALAGLSCAAPSSDPEPTSPNTSSAAQATALTAADVAAQAAADEAQLVELGAWVAANIEGPRYRVPYDEAELWHGAEQASLVTIVAFLDYQCPYSQRLAEALAQLIETYPQELRVVVKQMPLPMHKQARSAAQAVLAAHAQGRGWAMHTRLFDSQRELSRDDLRGHAQRVGVADMARFWADVEQGVDEAKISADMDLAKQLGMSSTPSFFINGVPYRGAQTFTDLRALYIDERERVEGLVQAGARYDQVYAALMLNAEPTREAPKRPSAVLRPGKADPSSSYAVPVDHRPALGPADALVTIIEFADFECPYCRKVQPTLAELRRRYGDDLRVVFRHQPLAMHTRAKEAARAAVAADRQGQFWAMHDALFALDSGIASADFSVLAAELGLDVDRFRADMADPTLDQVIEDDQEVAANFGAGGTPAFFINGRPISGAHPVEGFVGVIDEELAKARAYKKRKKIKGDKLYASMAKGWATKVERPLVADHKRRTISVKGHPGKGKLRKPALTMFMCADFDCPYSARGAEIMRDVLASDQYKDKVGLYFLHMPLPMHKNAALAHQAAIAADNQGQFWSMHDLLFADRERRSEAELLELAAHLSLDINQFKRDLHSQATRDKLDADKALCAAQGVSGTPTFFVNGRMMLGAVPMSMAAPVFDEELSGGFEQYVK